MPVVFHAPRKLRDLAWSHSDGPDWNPGCTASVSLSRTHSSHRGGEGPGGTREEIRPKDVSVPEGSEPAAYQLVATVTKSFSCLSSAAEL